MKTAFSILPPANGQKKLHLLIEAGTYGISFVWFTKSPLAVQGIIVYNLEEPFFPAEQLAGIKKILDTDSIFKQPVASVTISYNFKTSVLIPQEYFTESVARETVSLMYGDDASTVIKNESSGEIVNVFGIHETLDNYLSSKYPGAAIMHSSSAQLKQPVADNCLQCVVFHNGIKLLLFANGKPLIVQQFSYQSPSDVAYHLLNVCQQYDIEPAKIGLYLSGMIDKESNLYNELYKYFLDIQFVPASGATLPEEIQKYPGHFFSHLIALVSCVS